MLIEQPLNLLARQQPGHFDLEMATLMPRDAIEDLLDAHLAGR
jgi:hypothetical protein